MKTLIVHYLPRGERSRTRGLVQAARSALAAEDIEEVDLAAAPPPLFDRVSLPAYVRRNYAGEAISADETAALRVADRYAEQLVEADRLVIAFPMFNFSVPAAIKAWLDAVMQKGKTWKAGTDGYRGLLEGKRALVLMTAGGRYDGAMHDWDHATPLVRHALAFMGIEDAEVITAEGMNSEPGQADARIEQALARIRRAAAQLAACAG